jgi:hypothetical protein
MRKLIFGLSLVMVSSGAMAAGFPSLPGSSKKEEPASSGVSATDAQEAIVSDFKSALSLVLEAQGYVLKAVGKSGEASAAQASAARLSGDDCAAGCIEEVVESSKGAQQTISEATSQSASLDADGKKELAKAYKPLGKGTLKMIDLAPKTKDWAKSATGEMKSAGMMGAGKLKKKLASGLYIAKTLPKMLNTWTETTAGLVSYGKKQGVSTEGASGDEMEG